MEMKIEVENGKYTVVMDSGGLRALRYGSAWRDLTGDKLVFSLAWELREAREERDSYRTALEHIANGHPSAKEFAAHLLKIGKE